MLNQHKCNDDLQSERRQRQVSIPQKKYIWIKVDK